MSTWTSFHSFFSYVICISINNRYLEMVLFGQLKWNGKESLNNRPGKIWPGPISWPEPEGKIWVWVGVFRPGNKDGVNPYPTRKMMGRVGSTRGSHGSTRFSKDFFFFFPRVFALFFFWLKNQISGLNLQWSFALSQSFSCLSHQVLAPPPPPLMNLPHYPYPYFQQSCIYNKNSIFLKPRSEMINQNLKNPLTWK